MRRWQIKLLVILSVAVIGISAFWYNLQYTDVDMYTAMFADHCGDCHGEDMRGTETGVALIERRLESGDTVAAMMHSIRSSHAEGGLPAFQNLNEDQVKGLAIYVGERRLGQKFEDFRFYRPVAIPEGTVSSAEHDFQFEIVAQNLDPLSFSIEPLPDGFMLLTEKERGVSIISPDGEQSVLIKETPETGDNSHQVRGIYFGLGWLLDIALHPLYEDNGWIYLHYTHLCEDCGDAGLFSAATMSRLDRGRIRDGSWVDVENLWQAPPETYTSMPDTSAGGRIAFDNEGHVFFSVGMKEPLAFSSQELDSPHGKIHRINDDGSIPADNPFVVSGNADTEKAIESIWTYGHRSPQGLEWNAERGTAWNTEMGPRGGDEVNELLPGKNYGWPFHSLGLEYTGFTVARHELQDIEFDTKEVEMTLVDFTPSPALSSFVFYDGNRFPNWQGNVLLGTLKGSSVYRLVFDGNQLIDREILFKDVARVRDIEVGYDGLVYLLLENEAGSMIVRLVPA